MTASTAYVALLAAACVTVCFGVPLSGSEGDVERALIQKAQSWIRAHTDAVEGIVQREASRKTRLAEHNRICFLEDDPKDDASKQILLAISDLLNRKGCFGEHPLSDRDYQGWMDFGRRSAEERRSE